MLEAFALERGAARGGAEQETATPHVAEGPDEVAHPLEAEHRVEGEERHHRRGMSRIRRARGGEARHGAGLRDPLFEDLALLRLHVGQQQLGVDRLVELAERRVDLDLLEQAVHAERTGLVGDDRHHARAHVVVAQQAAQQPREHHRRRHGLLPGARVELGEDVGCGLGDGLGPGHPAGQRTVERATALHHVLVLR